MSKENEGGEMAGAPLPEVDTARCSGCGRCVAACPHRLFTLQVAGYRKYALLSAPARCSRCGRCVAACRIEALRFPVSDDASR